MDGEEEGERARFTLQTTEERTRSGKLGGAPDTTLPSENLANKRRKQERGETPLSGGEGRVCVRVRAGKVNGSKQSNILFRWIDHRLSPIASVDFACFEKYIYFSLSLSAPRESSPFEFLPRPSWNSLEDCCVSDV